MQRHIERGMPRGRQRRTTVEVKIEGVALENVREAIFYRDGVKAVEFSAAAKIQTRNLMHGARIEQEVTCRFEIADDCPVGVHPFRLRTDRELTSVSTFYATPYQVIPETETSSGMATSSGKSNTAARLKVLQRWNCLDCRRACELSENRRL
jgi:hypothetical protein